MKQWWRLILLVPLLKGCAPAEPRSGAEIFESCRLCHGAREMQRGPILDGLPGWYVAGQLKKFKNGVRGADPANRSAFLMASTMSALRNEEEIERVAEWISGLPPQNPLKTVRGDVAHGKTVYQTCVPCHGEKGEGRIEQNSPPLNILEDWYLLDQLRTFKTSRRGGNPRDVEGQVMRQALASLDEKDFRDVVRYIAVELAPGNEPRPSSPGPDETVPPPDLGTNGN